MASRQCLMASTLLALACSVGYSEEVFVEAEDYSRVEDTLIPAHILPRETASGKRLASRGGAGRTRRSAKREGG